MARFGDIDVYLFDQLLRGRITKGMRILDAGCGSGRKLVYLLRNGFDVWGVDEDPAAIVRVTALASRLAPSLPSGRFATGSVEKMSLEAESMDVVISSAVMHFARDEAHWLAMLNEMWRVGHDSLLRLHPVLRWSVTRRLVSRHEHPAMPFEILNSVSSCRRSIFRFREDDRSRGPGPGIVLVDVVDIDEHTINDPWQRGP